jgi:tRNA pseudouridine55 synthase
MNGPASMDGVLLISKPAGLTSHDVVERVRRSPLATGRKVGHAGTLDPFATGLLLVLVGQATRVQRFFVALPKTYRTRMRLGVSSDTGDPTGTLTRTGARAERNHLERVLVYLRGEIRQRVPLTSAVKVGGERLYRKARRGERFETPERVVRVDRLDLVTFDAAAQTATLEVDCSSGTYVRQLVSDLGELSGVGAHCETLERTAIGPFQLADADDRKLMPLREALVFLPEHRLAPGEAGRVRHGRSVEAGEGEGTEGAVRLTDGADLVAIAERRDGVLHPVTVLSAGRVE